MTIIESSDNARFRALLALAESARDRRRQQRALLDGPHLLRALKDAGQVPEQLVVSASGRNDPEILGLLSSLAAVTPLVLADALFARLAPVATATGVLAVISIPAPDPDAAGAGPAVLLEAIQDPGNVGSILRSSAAAGVGRVYLSPGCADVWSPKVLRAAMGAHFSLTIHSDVDLVARLGTFTGRRLALDHRATASVFSENLAGPVALIFGNEGAGLSAPVLRAADARVSIPMPGRAESLGVAAAAAVCLFERVRQLSPA
jgi:RNA methyltransferase, TrmH family